MADVMAEPRTRLKETAPEPLNGAPCRTVPENERSFALSLIKHPREPVLDVGTGDCACVASVLAGNGTRVVALDKDHETLLDARICLGALGVKRTVRLVQDDITASGLGSNSFHNVVCFNVLHHIAHLGDALAELHRVLASGGRVIISEFDENHDGFLERLEKAVNRQFQSVTAYRRRSGRLVRVCEK